MNPPLIGRTGIIQKGEYKGWFVKIEPSGDSAFLVLISSNNFAKGGEGYDHWVEGENLIKYFEECGWDITWTDLAYDEAALIEQLNNYPKRFCTIFALACAQRLFSSYCKYDPSGRILNIEIAEKIINSLWNDVLSDSITLTKAEGEKCTKMVLTLKDKEGEGTVAEDAMAAIAYVVRYHVGGDAKEFVIPARREIEIIDRYLVEKLSINFGDINAEKIITSNPLMQKILELQTWDLLDLRDASYDYLSKTVPEVTTVRKKKIELEIMRIRKRSIKNGSELIKW